MNVQTKILGSFELPKGGLYCTSIPPCESSEIGQTQTRTNSSTRLYSGQKDVGKKLTAWSVELLLYGTGIKRSCNSPPITFKSKG